MKLSTFLGVAALTAVPAALATSVSWIGDEGREQRPDEAATTSEDLLARMSNAVRTPLNAVIGMAERLLDGKLSAEQREQVTTIQSSGRALREIINELLDSSKAADGGVARESVPVPLKAARGDRRSATRQRRVLVVEHVATSQIAVQRMLEREGYAVEVASTGWEALTALERGLFDIVLMDWAMPEMDGFETARLIRERFANRRRIPIIAVMEDAQERREALPAAGIDDSLAKPFDRETLNAMLIRWLEGAGDRRSGGDRRAA